MLLAKGKMDRPLNHNQLQAEKRGFFGRFVFATDHKVIGLQYSFSGLAFMGFGLGLMIVMRWQMAHPGQAIPIVGGWLEKILEPGMIQKGAMTPQLFNAFGAMHGTIMVFLGVVPVLFGGFGNFLLPLQLGAPDMAFPRLNMASFHLYFLGG